MMNSISGVCMKSLHILFLYFVVLLSGCDTDTARAPDLMTPNAGKAVIYVYRVDQSADTGDMVPNVRINNESIGPLTRHGYFRVEVIPGPAHVALYVLDTGYETFWPLSQDLIVNLNVAPDTTHFIELTLNAAIVNLRETPHKAALERLVGMHLLN